MPNRPAWVKIVSTHSFKLGRSTAQVLIAAWSLYKAVQTLRSAWAAARDDVAFYD